MSEGRLRDVFHWAKRKTRWAKDVVSSEITPGMVASMSDLLDDGWTEGEVASLYVTTPDDVRARVTRYREMHGWL